MAVAFVTERQQYVFIGPLGTVMACLGAHPYAPVFSTQQKLLQHAYKNNWLCGMEPVPPPLTCQQEAEVAQLPSPARYINFLDLTPEQARQRSRMKNIFPSYNIAPIPLRQIVNAIDAPPPSYKSLFKKN